MFPVMKSFFVAFQIRGTANDGDIDIGVIIRSHVCRRTVRFFVVMHRSQPLVMYPSHDSLTIVKIATIPTLIGRLR